MKTAINGLSKFIEFVLAILMIALTLLTFYQVIMRYIFNNASSWSEEAIRYLFVWASCVGAAVGIRYHTHIGIDVIVNRFPSPVRRVVAIFGYLLIIGFSLILITYGYQLVGKTGMQISPALRLPMKWVYMAAPVGGVLMILYALEEIVLIIASRKGDK